SSAVNFSKKPGHNADDSSGDISATGLADRRSIQMHILKSRVMTDTPEFAANAAFHRRNCDALQELVATLALGGDENSRQRHVKRGKLLPRERVEALLDTGTAFLEFSQLAAWQV